MKEVLNSLSEFGTGMQDSLRNMARGYQKMEGDTKGDTKYPQGFWLGDAKFPRVHGSGIPQTGEAKFSMTTLDQNFLKLC